MEISKILTLSTAHITESVSEALDNDPNTNELGLTVYKKADYGWFIYIPEDYDKTAKEGLPECLKACIDLALKNDCNILCLDCDGEEEPTLPTYEW